MAAKPRGRRGLGFSDVSLFGSSEESFGVGSLLGRVRARSSSRQRVQLLTSDPVSLRVLLLEGLLNEHTDRLYQREREAIDMIKTIQIRRLLLSTRIKVAYLFFGLCVW